MIFNLENNQENTISQWNKLKIPLWLGIWGLKQRPWIRTEITYHEIGQEIVISNIKYEFLYWNGTDNQKYGEYPIVVDSAEQLHIYDEGGGL